MHVQAVFDPEVGAQRGWLRGMQLGAVDWAGRSLRGAKLQNCDLSGMVRDAQRCLTGLQEPIWLDVISPKRISPMPLSRCPECLALINAVPRTQICRMQAWWKPLTTWLSCAVAGFRVESIVMNALSMQLGAKLGAVEWRGKQLNKALLKGCDLQGADLSQANLTS